MEERRNTIKRNYPFFRVKFNYGLAHRHNIITAARGIAQGQNVDSVMKKYERNKALLRGFGVREIVLERGDKIMLKRAERYLRMNL